jgi:hypothetical protein
MTVAQDQELTNRDEFAGAPDQAIHLNRLDRLEHGIHVCLIVPGLVKRKTQNFNSPIFMKILYITIATQLSDTI